MRPTFAEVNLSAIAGNLQEINSRVTPAKVMAVVKADAYGHGLKAVAETAAASGAHYFGVALAEEGVTLRRQGTTLPILVFGGILRNSNRKIPPV